jgi:hypothetical protein
MSKIQSLVIVAVLLVVFGGIGIAAQDKYSVKVPGGLSFSEFKGYENWQVVAISATDNLINVIVANPVMIKAYKAGTPGNGKPFPDGSKSAKLQWKPTKSPDAPFSVNVPDTLIDIAFMVRGSKRFAESGNWGYGLFNYDIKSDSFTPATKTNNPPQANDAKCGFACHTAVKSRDYVFTAFSRPDIR